MFGHSAIRVQDNSRHTDEIYNYGLFDFWDPDFYLKFTTGKLLYFVGKENYLDFINIYEQEGRSVIEQELKIDLVQKIKIVHFLENNLLPENRSYKYDFLYDNCATRIKDIFPKELGSKFQFGKIIDSDQSVTFRALLNQYLQNDHWVRLGINIILGSRVDQKMTNEQTMFLPDLLMAGMAKASFENHSMVSKTNKILEGHPKPTPGFNQPLWLMMGILLVTIVVFFLPQFEKLRKPLVFIVLFISGLLGCFLLFAWLGTDHQSFGNNYNLLWAFPLNLLVSFTVFKARAWHKNYSILALVALLLSFLISLSGIQQMPLLELVSFLFVLLYCYLFLNKRAKSIVKDLKANG